MASATGLNRPIRCRRLAIRVIVAATPKSATSSRMYSGLSISLVLCVVDGASIDTAFQVVKLFLNIPSERVVIKSLSLRFKSFMSQRIV